MYAAGAKTRRQAAIVDTELQAMRTFLYGYAVHDIDLPLLVVRICPCTEGRVVSER